jgi:hypothetical protein
MRSFTDEEFRVGLVQMSCALDPNENLEKAKWKIREAAAQGAQIVCLVEWVYGGIVRRLAQKERGGFWRAMREGEDAVTNWIFNGWAKYGKWQRDNAFQRRSRGGRTFGGSIRGWCWRLCSTILTIRVALNALAELFSGREVVGVAWKIQKTPVTG